MMFSSPPPPPSISLRFDWLLDVSYYAEIIRANIDKTVHVSYSDGTSRTLLVHTVDDEGFVCDIASELNRPPRFAYCVRFADVHDVLPVAPEFKLEKPSFTVEFLEHLSPQTGSNGSFSLETPAHPLSRRASGCMPSSAHDHNSSLMSGGCCFTAISAICVALFPLLAVQRPVPVHTPNLPASEVSRAGTMKDPSGTTNRGLDERLSGPRLLAHSVARYL